jgi:hypothetical protein
LLVNEDKYGSTYYLLADGAAFYRGCLHILGVRLADGYIADDDEDFYPAHRALEQSNGTCAAAILGKRRRYEYERVMLELVVIP